MRVDPSCSGEFRNSFRNALDRASKKPYFADAFFCSQTAPPLLPKHLHCTLLNASGMINLEDWAHMSRNPTCRFQLGNLPGIHMAHASPAPCPTPSYAQPPDHTDYQRLAASSNRHQIPTRSQRNRLNAQQTLPYPFQSFPYQAQPPLGDTQIYKHPQRPPHYTTRHRTHLFF
jgi:hypothetical protein